MSLAEIENREDGRPVVVYCSVGRSGGMLPQEIFGNFRCAGAHFGAF